MPDSGQDPHLQRSRTMSSGQWASNGVVALLPVFTCFLGGGTQKWAEGLVVAILGLYLLARPPRVSLGLAINCVLLAFVALAAMAFLPADWFSFPAWPATTNRGSQRQVLRPTSACRPQENR